jgi:hypothetical protein
MARSRGLPGGRPAGDARTRRERAMRVIQAVAATVVLSMALVISIQAATQGSTRNLFKSAGPKQTATDFEPAPDKIRTDFGTLRFVGGAFPTDESVEDLRRARPAARHPGLHGLLPGAVPVRIVKGQIRDFGFKSSSDIAVMAGPFMQPSENYLTGNDVTVYAFASLDLKVDGPTVVEIPPGMYGTANDAIFKYLVDFGPPAPTRARAASTSSCPPGTRARSPTGTFDPLPGYRIWAMMRGFGEVGTGEQAVDWFRGAPQGLPAGHRSPAGTSRERHRHGREHASAGRRLRVRDARRDHPVRTVRSCSWEQLGRLASLGIEKGKPFAPDARMSAFSTRRPSRGSPCPGPSSTPTGTRRSTTGRTGTGRRCSSATRSSCATATTTSTRGPSGTTRPSASRRTCSPPPRVWGRPT